VYTARASGALSSCSKARRLHLLPYDGILLQSAAVAGLTDVEYQQLVKLQVVRQQLEGRAAHEIA
jgi:hypothetical protein